MIQIQSFLKTICVLSFGVAFTLNAFATSNDCTIQETRAQNLYSILMSKALSLKLLRRSLPLNFECSEHWTAKADLDGVTLSLPYARLLKDDELAAILSHEISHLYSLYPELDDTCRLPSTHLILHTIPENYRSEALADQQGVVLLKETGMDPFAAVRALEKVTQATGDLNDGAHFPFEARKEWLQSQIKDLTK